MYAIDKLLCLIILASVTRIVTLNFLLVQLERSRETQIPHISAGHFKNVLKSHKTEKAVKPMEEKDKDSKTKPYCKNKMNDTNMPACQLGDKCIVVNGRDPCVNIAALTINVAGANVRKKQNSFYVRCVNDKLMVHGIGKHHNNQPICKEVDKSCTCRPHSNVLESMWSGR